MKIIFRRKTVGQSWNHEDCKVAGLLIILYLIDGRSSDASGKLKPRLGIFDEQKWENWLKGHYQYNLSQSDGLF